MDTKSHGPRADLDSLIQHVQYHKSQNPDRTLKKTASPAQIYNSQRDSLPALMQKNNDLQICVTELVKCKAERQVRTEEGKNTSPKPVPRQNQHYYF